MWFRLSLNQVLPSLCEGQINSFRDKSEMDLIKSLKHISVLAAMGAAFTVMPASAASNVLTATISAQGKVVAQAPEWISAVEYFSQPDYFANYKVNFKPDVFIQAPRFCSVSLTNSRSEDDIYYGRARLGSTPKEDNLSVITQLAGMKGPSGDGSQDFMLMCIK